MKDISLWNHNTRMDRGMIQLWFVVLYASSCTAAPVSDSLVVLVGSPDSIQRGHSTTLPCWLSPPQNVEDLEVRWYRVDRFDTPIVLYQAKKSTFDDASYVGRVSFGLKDATSGGLKTGDVSLKLVNVTTEDTGDYTCYVSSHRGYDSATLSLLVTETGSTPRLKPVWTDDNNMANVSCNSEGWYPQPVLHWSGPKEDLTPENVVYSKDSSGLYSVYSWFLLPSSSEVSCSVGLPNKEAKGSSMALEKPPPIYVNDKLQLGGWVAFTLLLVAVLAALAVMYFKKKGKKHKPGRDHTEENETLLPTVLSKAEKCYVNIQLEDTNNAYVKIKDNKLRDAQRDDFPDGQRVTCVTAVKGTSGFSSGQNYWEVSLGNVESVGLKQSWWVGVTSATESLQTLEVSPVTSNGFWFLSSSPGKADCLQFSTESEVSLPVHVRPQIVGVHLDCDSKELSFYNVGDKSLIGSLTVAFTGQVFPIFNPGKGDKAPMEILQRTKQSQSSDIGNSVDGISTRG